VRFHCAGHPVYSCPAGWSLSETTCTLQQVSTASVTGYNCPANYTLTGTNCVSTQPAGISGYTCPSGYTLDGTTCFQTLASQPARRPTPAPKALPQRQHLLRKPLAARQCQLFLPRRHALSGTTCTLTTQAAAIISYQCPSGWTLNGELCQSQTDYPALDTYVPSTWTLTGSTCTSASTYNASLIYTCPEGWNVSGASCLRNTSYAPDVAYSCPGGWNLNGSTCTQQSSYPAHVT
jgi:conjugal transfer mating pair stabilization protein TraN